MICEVLILILDASMLVGPRARSDISELRLQEHWDMLVVTNGDARS
ncbi:hypothetical protein Tco_1450755, partial [Tanacetum coccineum]